MEKCLNLSRNPRTTSDKEIHKNSIDANQFFGVSKLISRQGVYNFWTDHGAQEHRFLRFVVLGRVQCHTMSCLVDSARLIQMPSSSSPSFYLLARTVARHSCLWICNHGLCWQCSMIQAVIELAAGAAYSTIRKSRKHNYNITQATPDPV